MAFKMFQALRKSLPFLIAINIANYITHDFQIEPTLNYWIGPLVALVLYIVLTLLFHFIKNHLKQSP